MFVLSIDMPRFRCLSSFDAVLLVRSLISPLGPSSPSDRVKTREGLLFVMWRASLHTIPVKVTQFESTLDEHVRFSPELVSLQLL